jgi:hypothetical protein
MRLGARPEGVSGSNVLKEDTDRATEEEEGSSKIGAGIGLCGGGDNTLVG